MSDLDALFTGPLPQTVWIVGPAEALEEAADEVLHRALCLEGYACGRCPSCRLWDRGCHPDLLDPAGEDKAFDVAMARAGGSDLALAPVAAPRRVLRVRRADLLLPAAANSLLKIAEEPPEHGMVLFTGEGYNLLPTLRSRSRLVVLPGRPVPPVALPQGDRELFEALQSWAKLDGAGFAALAEGLASDALAEGQVELAACLSQLAREGAVAHLSANQWVDLLILLLRGDYPVEYLFDSLRQTPIFGRR